MYLQARRNSRGEENSSAEKDHKGLRRVRFPHFGSIRCIGKIKPKPPNNCTAKHSKRKAVGRNATSDVLDLSPRFPCVPLATAVCEDRNRCVCREGGNMPPGLVYQKPSTGIKSSRRPKKTQTASEVYRPAQMHLYFIISRTARRGWTVVLPSCVLVADEREALHSSASSWRLKELSSCFYSFGPLPAHENKNVCQHAHEGRRPHSRKYVHRVVVETKPHQQLRRLVVPGSHARHIPPPCDEPTSQTFLKRTATCRVVARAGGRKNSKQALMAVVVQALEPRHSDISFLGPIRRETTVNWSSCSTPRNDTLGTRAVCAIAESA